MADRATDPAGVRLFQIMRLINIVALLAFLGVLAESLFLQCGIGEQSCPLCHESAVGVEAFPLRDQHSRCTRGRCVYQLARTWFSLSRNEPTTIMTKSISAQMPTPPSVKIIKMPVPFLPT